MKELNAQKVLNALKGRLNNVADVSVDYIIDFENGNSVGIEEIQEWNNQYNELNSCLESFIEENGYDNVTDYDAIINDASTKEMKANGYLLSNQATMINFEDYCFALASAIAA